MTRRSGDGETQGHKIKRLLKTRRSWGYIRLRRIEEILKLNSRQLRLTEDIHFA
jgi:hypothetical protein